MRIFLEIPDAEINKIAGDKGAKFTMAEFKRDPQWFVDASHFIKIELEAE